MKWLARYSTLAGLLGCVAWFTHAPDWEPAIGVVTTFAAFIALDVVAQRAAARDEHRVLADRELFNRFRAILPHDPTMRFFREHDYGGEFERGRHDSLYKFTDFCKTPDCNFITPKLEAERIKLQQTVDAFRAACVNRIFPGNQSGWCSVPGDWLHTGPRTPSYERFQEAQDTLNKLSDEMCAAYDSFVQTGRQLLLVA